MRGMVRYFDCGCTEGYAAHEFCDEGKSLHKEHDVLCKRLSAIKRDPMSLFNGVLYRNAKHVHDVVFSKILDHYADQIRSGEYEDVILEEVKCPDTPEALLKLSDD